MKTQKRLMIVFCLLAGLLLGLLLARPVYDLCREVSFHWEERSEAAWEVWEYAKERGVSIGRWPWEIIALYESNPETREFVMNYPFREDREVDITSYTTEKGVPLFLQWDPMWGYDDYGSSCLAVTGCGPAALAMAGYYLTEDPSMNPAAIARFAEKGGYYAPGYGSSWTLISQGAGELGLTARELPLVKKKITDAIQAGNPVILAMGPGDFTTTGHYIVLTGVENGAFRVNDPNSRIRSERLWTYEELEGQIRNIWAIGKG